MGARVLIVDDDPELAGTVVATLERGGYQAQALSCGVEALAALARGRYDVVLADVRARGLDGLELCQRVRAAHPELPVILSAASAGMSAAVAAIRAGAYDFLSKPVEADALLIAVERAVSHHALREEVRLLKERLREAEPFEELIGESPEVRELCALVDRVAPLDATLLITGETGTGKELVARALHRRSRRAAGRFLAVNCAALPEPLLESELFGHVPGAFTGALGPRSGLFQEASGGTLLLDEIGDMPPALQVRLLRVLEVQRVRPVGSDEEVPVDVRIIAATHRDLEAEVEEGRFRQDLLYRVNVIQVDVPPLRSRGNDVLLLAQHFVERFAEEAGRQVLGISSGAADRLLRYDWPGNVRELRNCIERAVALTCHDRLVEADLPPGVREYAPPAPAQDDLLSEGDLLPLEAIERRYILRVLRAVGGNKARAARVLRVGRKTLYRKLEQYRAAADDRG